MSNNIINNTMTLERVYEILTDIQTKKGYSGDIKQNGGNVEDLIITKYDFKYYPDAGFTENDFDILTLVDEEGGEDCGSYYHKIFKVKDKVNDTECFVKYVGHYDSWNGTDWYNNPTIVTPVKKMVEITEWHDV